MLVEVAGIIIKNNDNKYLMCHPTHHSEKWTIPKGHIENGETPLIAAKRETFEETNIDVDTLDGNLRYINHLNYKSGGNTKKLYVYLFESNVDINTLDLEIKCTSYFTLPNGKLIPEMDDYKWLTYDAVVESSMKFVVKFFNYNKNSL